MKILESQLRHLINNLLIEAKADMLQARHPHIDVHALATLDPTATKKYLEWMIKVVDSDKAIDMEELGLTIRQFNSAQQRLQGKQRDINTYKSLSDLQATLNDIGTTSKTQKKQTAKASGSQYVGNVDGWDVYFITSHQAAMLLGKGTKWCITQKNATYWNEYISKVKFFYALRKVPQGNAFDKIAYACYLTNNNIEVFNAQDKSISVNNKSIIKLTNFINEIKTKYSDYTIISKNSIKPFFNNKLHGIVKYSNGTTEHYANGVLHRENGPAVERANGSKEWWINGKHHREGGPAVELIDGTKKWLLNGKLHREDGPAIERGNGDKEWWINDKRHRIDGPAIEYNSGSKEWWINGKRHREDGPAIESSNGNKEWWVNGKRHREGGPAIEWADGNKEWWLNGKLHREDGPAIENNDGSKLWYINGMLHRLDGPAIELQGGTKKWLKNNNYHRINGPAIEWADGSKEWWLYDHEYRTEAEYKRALKTLGLGK